MNKLIADWLAYNINRNHNHNRNRNYQPLGEPPPVKGC